MELNEIDSRVQQPDIQEIQADEQAKTQYIFIVGVSRSGTTLMRNILNRSDQIAISRENHFLGHLIGTEGVRYQIKRFGDLKDDDNVRRLVEYIYSGGLESSSRFRRASAHWRWITRRIDKQVFLQHILASDRSERALFVVLMHLFAERKGKPIMGEKTPAHFRYASTLLTWFPDAKIIHMVRDPRGIFISELRRRKKEADSFPYRQLKRIPALMKLYILLQTTFTWRESMHLGRQHQKDYPHSYRLQRFEDLVRNPEIQIRDICAFLNVEFQPAMLEQSVVSQGFQENQTGFDSGAADRWQKYIDSWIDTWFRLMLRGTMVVAGYSKDTRKK